MSLDLVIVSRERSDLRNYEGDFVKKDVFSFSHGRKKQSNPHEESNLGRSDSAP